MPMVAIPSNYAGWLRFQRLDSLQGISQVYAIAWRFTDESTDLWTKRLLSFKHGGAVQPAISALNIAIKDLLNEARWSVSETALVPALSSGDACTNPGKPIPRLAESCAQMTGLTYLPDILQKQPHRRLHTLGSAIERRNEVRNAGYTANLALCTGIKRILIIDDLVTNGDTMSAIACAIRSQNQAIEIHGIALGKNESKAYAGSHGHTISNEHVPQSWNEAWDNGN